VRLPAKVDEARAWVDARSRRERLLLGGAVLALVVLAWELAVRSPLYERWSGAVERTGAVRAETEELRARIRDLEERVAAATGGEGRSPSERLEARIAEIDEALAQRTRRVVSPRQMVSVLRDLVSADPALGLVALRNTGVEPLIEQARGEAAGDGAAAEVPRVYRHRVEVVVEGRYFDLVAYLERLEELPWQFQWDALEVRTIEYPNARATLSLSTLSLAEDWIGV
jgi:MSHA biogenesis protein MshJ